MANVDPSKALAEKLSQIRGGHSADVMLKKLKEANLAALATGKKAIVTLKLTIEPDKNDENCINVTPKVTVSIPEKPFAPGIFYVNAVTGDMTREDPRQLELLAEKEAEREAERERQRAEGIAHLDRVGRGSGTDG